ncbi:MAG TPA: hypothetical protein VGZ22_01750, partial [Isosphaeraceae bacterium]|nr:hypothetical protein [Isosphaeraceae bacterium]
MRRSRRLWGLLIAHLIAGVVSARVANIQGLSVFGLTGLPRIPLVAVVLGQSCLLGFWAAQREVPWWRRLAGLIVGAVTLGLLFGTPDL